MKQTPISVSYAGASYGEEEKQAVQWALDNPSQMVAGPSVRTFEKKIARLFGKAHGVMVNSGSSANLLALNLLDLPRGAEVITPALTFSTTVAPIIQLGLTPVFADVLPARYTIDIDQIEPLITKKTKALMIPSLFGSIPDLIRLRALANKHHLTFIEDSCDTVGAKFDGQPTGVYSDISTTSFYASHIITAAGGGGMVCFHDPELAKRALVMSNWGRNSTLFGSYQQGEDIRKRFAGRIDGEPYDAKFIFSEVGYNMQPLELQGAFGLVQLAHLPKHSQVRRQNFNRLRKFFLQYEKFFILPEEDPRMKTNWLAFPLTLRPDVPFTRLELTTALEKRHIQTRPIFTGNILKQPGFRAVRPRRTRRGGYPVTDEIMRQGFVVGAHHGLTAKHLSYMMECFDEFLERYAQ